MMEMESASGRYAVLENLFIQYGLPEDLRLMLLDLRNSAVSYGQKIGHFIGAAQANGLKKEQIRSLLEATLQCSYRTIVRNLPPDFKRQWQRRPISDNLSLSYSDANASLSELTEDDREFMRGLENCKCDAHASHPRDMLAELEGIYVSTPMKANMRKTGLTSYLGSMPPEKFKRFLQFLRWLIESEANMLAMHRTINTYAQRRKASPQDKSDNTSVSSEGEAA